MGGLTATERGTKCWKMETPAVAGASLRFTTVIDFNKLKCLSTTQHNLIIISILSNLILLYVDLF